MSEQVKRIPINYTGSDIELKLINGGNINMEEEDFVFGSVRLPQMDRRPDPRNQQIHRRHREWRGR